MEEVEKSIFSMEAFLTPERFVLSDYPRRPTSAFNPAAYVRQGKLVLLPRLIFDDKFYVSSVGICEPISFDDLAKEVIETRLLKYPQRIEEINGVEDPRITEDGKKLLTVGVGDNFHKSQTMLMDFDGEHLSNERLFYFNNSVWETGRDAVLINDKVLLFRPDAIPKSFTTYRVFYELKDGSVFIESDGLKAILEIGRGEKKRGFSTNAVKISSNEYLVGWHGALEDTSYKNGFMLVNDEGLPLGITDYLLETTGFLQYGNRPFTLFGCGLIKLKDKLFWVGGVGDWAIGIFTADLDLAMSKLKWLNG